MTGPTTAELVAKLRERAAMTAIRSVPLQDGRAVLSMTVRSGSLWLAVFDVLHDPNADRAVYAAQAVNNYGPLVEALEKALARCTYCRGVGTTALLKRPCPLCGEDRTVLAAVAEAANEALG